MPVNEIHAPFYLKGKIATPVYNQGHAWRLYFEAGTTMTPGLAGDEDNWRIVRDGDDKGSVDACVDDLFSRFTTALPANSHVTEIEIWQSIPDAENLLVHLNTLPLGNSYGTGGGVASAFMMQVYGTALREQFRFTVFDGDLVSPQRYPPVSPPVSDDGGLTWFFVRSDWGIATNDGIKITRQISSNTGYNKKLARKYGRTISP